jgi:hypothetical protein
LPHSVKSCRVSYAVISTVETCLLAVRQTSFRRHDLYPGLITELGNLSCNAKGNAQREQPEGRIPMSRNRDGLTRSSDEVSVMEMERRG